MQVKKCSDANLVNSNIKSVVTIFGVTGNYSGNTGTISYSGTTVPSLSVSDSKLFLRHEMSYMSASPKDYFYNNINIVSSPSANNLYMSNNGTYNITQSNFSNCTINKLKMVANSTCELVDNGVTLSIKCKSDESVIDYNRICNIPANVVGSSTLVITNNTTTWICASNGTTWTIS